MTARENMKSKQSENNFFASLDFVLNQLNRGSGLLGLTGSADSRDVEDSALKGNLKGCFYGFMQKVILKIRDWHFYEGS